MTNYIIPAVYENGVFRPLQTPPMLAEHQGVQLYRVVVPSREQVAAAVERLQPEQLADLWEIISGWLDAAPSPLYRIHESALATGVNDLAEQHDHYLYAPGTCASGVAKCLRQRECGSLSRSVVNDATLRCFVDPSDARLVC